MYQKLIFLFVFSLFLLSAGRQVHSQTEVLWSKNYYYITGVKFSKDGQTVLIASKDTVYLFDAYTGEPTMYENVHLPVINREILHIDISNDGTNFGALYSDTIRIWNYHSGEIINTLYIPVAGTFKFINNSRHFITKKWFDEENKWGFIIYDYDNGEEIKSGLAPNLTGITAFSNDDRYLAYATPGSSSFGIVLWDIETMKTITTLGYTSGIARDIAFSPDGKYLGVTDSDGYIKVWDLKTKEKIVDMLHTDAPGKNLFANQIIFSKNSDYLFVGGGYDNIKTTKVWKVPSFEFLHIYEHPYGAASNYQGIDISPDDSLLALIHNSRLLYVVKTDFSLSGILKNDIENDTIVFPNPIKDLLTIEFEVPFSKNTQIKIYDTAGLLMELLSSNDLPITSYTLTYNCSHLPAGKYFITIEQDDFFKTYSFVKL
jgi:WD40 repeat protein